MIRIVAVVAALWFCWEWASISIKCLIEANRQTKSPVQWLAFAVASTVMALVFANLAYPILFQGKY